MLFCSKITIITFKGIKIQNIFKGNKYLEK